MGSIKKIAIQNSQVIVGIKKQHELPQKENSFIVLEIYQKASAYKFSSFLEIMTQIFSNLQRSLYLNTYSMEWHMTAKLF